MTNSAALSGDYVDLRFIKSRKVCQVIIEIPIEQGSAFVQAFGTPNPATGVPVAIARLTEQGAKPEKSKRTWDQLSRAEQAGIACEDVEFVRYLGVRHSVTSPVAEAVRGFCGVHSRSELNNNDHAAARWDKLYSDYQLWKRGAAA